MQVLSCLMTRLMYHIDSFRYQGSIVRLGNATLGQTFKQYRVENVVALTYYMGMLNYLRVTVINIFSCGMCMP